MIRQAGPLRVAVIIIREKQRIVHSCRHRIHGSRIIKQHGFLEVVVIAAPSDHKALIVHGLQNIRHGMAHHRTVFRFIILAHTQGIFTKGYIKPPVQAGYPLRKYRMIGW